MILSGECGVFSPKLLECFKHVRGRFAELAVAYADGQSPLSDAITAPLSPPISGSASSLQTLLTKHTALIQHLNATVMEVDIRENVYHLTYVPDPNLPLPVGATTLTEALALWSHCLYLPTGDPLPPLHIPHSLEAFLASGLRRQHFDYLLRCRDGSLCPYGVTLLRLEGDISSHKALILWQRSDGAAAAEAASSELSSPLSGISQLLIFDRFLTMPHISAELSHMLGSTGEQLAARSGSRLMELVPESERSDLRESLRQQFLHGTVCQTELPLLREDGTTVWCVMKGILRPDPQGRELIHCVFVDVTQTKQAQEKLRLTLARQQLIFDQSSDIIFELDFLRDKFTCSPKWEARFGYRPINDRFFDALSRATHFHPDDVAVFREKMEQLRKGTPVIECTVRVADSTGRYRWSRVRASLQRDSSGQPARAVGVFIDIDDELRTSWALMASADRDSLTKLLNKDACRREVEACLSREDSSAPGALAIIDLDNFKNVNDRRGHLFGDAVLSRVAGEISRTFRGTDVVGRIGGDEFLVFMPDIPDQKPALDRFAILTDSIRRLLEEHTGDPTLSCSVGLAFTPDHGTAYEELFQRADRALYQAKSMGKNRCNIYSPSSPLALPTMVNDRIDSNLQPGPGSSSLIQFFFERLYESGDMAATIQSLMELVGTEMDVSRVYIFENNEDNTACSNTFEWCSEGISPEIHNLQNVSYITDIPGFEKNFNERGIFYCPDVSQLSQELRDILEPQGIRSLLHCAIRDRGVFRGYVGFDDNRNVRLWGQEQIDLLTFLSRLVSVFLLKQRAQDRTELTVRELRRVLDSQFAWTYIVDPDSHTLRFANGKVLELTAEAREGALCHKALMGRDTPCEQCPIHCGSCLIRNDHLGVQVTARSHSIHWEGKPSCLITCNEELL